jgi:hypothetical protein
VIPRPLVSAPRGHFRGKRGYYRSLRRRAEQEPLPLPLSPDLWCHFWHYHADWPGWGNLGWRHRKEHLRAHGVVFRRIVSRASAFALPFQTWILLSLEDAGQDAVYLHTPNPHSSFPCILTDVDWGVPSLELALSPIVGERPMRVGRSAGALLLYCPAVGEPLEAPGTPRTTR